MSYDLAVFDPRQELRDRAEFEAWYDSTEEDEYTADYSDPGQATPSLQAWFHEMREHFVPLNGPYSPHATSDPRLEKAGDYSIGPDLIYVAFSWSQVEEAYELCFRLAQKHCVGFLDASGAEGAAWFPTPDGTLERVHIAADADTL
jgi:hypothetical protein